MSIDEVFLRPPDGGLFTGGPLIRIVRMEGEGRGERGEGGKGLIDV